MVSAGPQSWCLARAKTLFAPDAKTWGKGQSCIWQSCWVHLKVCSPDPLQPPPVYNPQSREPAGFRLWVLKGCHGNREEKRGREGAHAGGDRAEPGGEGLVTANVRGQQRTLCAQCLACARLQQPQLLYALSQSLQKECSINSSSSP